MTSRIFEHAFAWQLTSWQAARAAAMLADAARLRGPVSEVIAVARGGVQPARDIAGALGVRLRRVEARHNPGDDLYAQATGHVRCAIPGLEAGTLRGCVLIVDDICGTGATLEAVTAALAPLAAPGTRLCTATLCRNAGAVSRPDLTVWDNLREWVIFPWETTAPADIPVRMLPVPAKVHAA
jgi:uncharacterized protein